MNAVLLCPGLSLSLLDALPPCDLSMAVNRAALRFNCDWWSTLDYPTIRDNCERVTAPNLLSHRQTIKDSPLEQFRHVLAFEDLNGFCPSELKAGTFSSTMGLVALAFIGAREIHVYGADMKGTADYDGKEAGENRTDARWSREGFLWGRIVEWLGGKGVEVHRHITVTA